MSLPIRADESDVKISSVGMGRDKNKRTRTAQNTVFTTQWQEFCEKTLRATVIVACLGDIS